MIQQSFRIEGNRFIGVNSIVYDKIELRIYVLLEWRTITYSVQGNDNIEVNVNKFK